MSVKDAGPVSTGNAAVVAEAKALLAKCREASSLRELVPPLEAFFSLLRRASASQKRFRFFFRSADLAPTSKFAAWLLHAFDQLQAILEDLLESETCEEEERQATALRFFMCLFLHQHSLELGSQDASRSEKGPFPLASFQRLVARLLRSARFAAFQEVLLSEYLCKFADLRYYFLVVLRKILSEHRRQTPASAPSRLPDAAGAFPPQPAEGEAEDALTDSALPLETPTEEKWYAWKAEDLTELARRVYPILVGLPAPEATKKAQSRRSTRTEEENSSELELTDSDAEETAASRSRENDSGDFFLSNVKATKCGDAALYRSLFQEVWLLFLRNLPRDSKMTQSLLHAVPRVLLPHMANPLLLADFFLDAFHASDQTVSVAVLALSGLFFLLAKHRLGDPDALAAAESAERSGGASPAQDDADASASSRKVCFHFYQRLFQMLTPAAFAVAKNNRFRRLLNAALRSSLLPNSLVAAFIKKCARVACLVAPATALYLVALVYALLKKHGSVCVSLVDVHPSLAAQLSVAGDAFDFNHLSLAAAPPAEGVSGDTETVRPTGPPARDAFWAGVLQRCLPTHAKVDKAGVLACVKQQAQMSLWEVDLLRNHFFHAVRQLSCMFDSDVTKPGGNEVDINDYLSLDFESLLSRELTRAAKADSAAVVFKKEEHIPADIESLANVAVGCFQKRRKLR
ncbi:UNVERIFIED_CONTAM: CBF/Mak21 family protein [Hammondia hammondi]|eukprot:XP_008885192.1 CBF/Mak21 family protein [Hammondia hammondi]